MCDPIPDLRPECLAFADSVSTVQGELPEAFFQLLVESVKVEALIGLRDALAPNARVPLPGRTAQMPPSQTPEEPRAQSSSAADGRENAEDEGDTDAGTGHLLRNARPQSGKGSCSEWTSAW